MGRESRGRTRVVRDVWLQLGSTFRQQSSHEERVRVAFDQFDPPAIAPNILPQLGSFIAAIIASKALRHVFPDAIDDIDAIGKGFESEIVTRMNQQLDDLADIARENPDVATALRDGSMRAEIQRVDGGTEFVDTFDAFLDEFDHRGTGEIDQSRSRWKDDTTPLLQTIRNNLT